MWEPRAATRLRIGCAPSWEAARVGGNEAGSCCRELPKHQKCFFFLFFFLKNFSYSSLPVQTSTWPLTQPSLALSQESCSRSSGHWAWGCSHPGPCAGPRTGPRDLIILKHSPYCLIFQCPLQFLVSNLHICWDTVVCSLCSLEDLLGVSPVLRGKWTLLPSIPLPSSWTYFPMF